MVKVVEERGGHYFENEQERMSRDFVIILAAGKQTRWEGKELKQFLPIGETTIIERTIAQLQARLYNFYVINRYLPTSRVGNYQGGRIFHLWRGEKEAPICRFTCETLLHTYQLDCWNYAENIVVLLGDTIYSHATLDRILKCREPIRFYGNPWELFAISFSVKLKDKIIAALEKTIAQAEDKSDTVPHFRLGKLRHFYRNYCNIGVEGDIEHPLFGKIDSLTDYTHDVDTRDEYDNFLRERLDWMIQDDREYGRNGI